MRGVICIVVSLLVSIMSGFCQNETRTILTEFGQAKVHLKSSSAASKANEMCMYYYVDANQLIITQGAFHGALLHGKASFFSKSGVLSSEGGFKSGLKDGKWIHWNEKGRITEVVTWKKGIKHGRYKRIYEDGSIEEGAWKNDRMHGTWTYSDGSTKMREARYKKGMLLQEEKEFEVKKFEEKLSEKTKKTESKEADKQKK